MRLKFSVLIVMVVATAACASAADPPAVEQDAELLRYMSRALPWYPDSTFKIIKDSRKQTPSGSYRMVEVERSCASRFLTGITLVVIDEPSSTIWFGSATRLPAHELKGDAAAIREFIDATLPGLVLDNMRMRIKVDWKTSSNGASTIMPFDMVVESGYGTHRRSAGVTIDGANLVMGAPLPYDRDPIEYRLELFASSDIVVWDHQSNTAKVKIVEFSDLECPGCRVKWPLINSAMKKHGEAVAHGMVNFPLPAIHPWSFRAASAAWCVAEQNPDSLIGFKELFYGLQQDMELSLVTDTAVDYVLGQNLDEEKFRSCYLKPQSLHAVHRQMELGSGLAVRSTPSYFVNGWLVQIPDVSWFPQLIDRMVAGEGP